MSKIMQKQNNKEEYKMLLENIDVGMIIKNYKVFCNLVGEKVKSGKSKKIQLDNWSRFLEYRKDGHSFIITKIYDEPIEKVDNRTGNNNVYGDYIQRLIMDLLLQNSKQDNERVLSFSTNRLLRALEMVNDNYVYCRNNIPNFSEYIKIKEKFIYEFFEMTHSNLQRAMETALNNLESQNLIIWNKVMMVCVEKNYTVHHRNATDAEKELIMQCRDKIMQEMDFDSLHAIVSHRKWNVFSSKVNKLLHEQTDIVYFYNAYKLVINRDRITSDYDEIVDQWVMSGDLRVFNKIKLNELVISRTHRNITKRQSDVLRMTEECIGEPKYTVRQHARTQTDYLESEYTLTDTLINRDHKNIVGNIKNYGTLKVLNNN